MGVFGLVLFVGALGLWLWSGAATWILEIAFGCSDWVMVAAFLVFGLLVLGH